MESLIHSAHQFQKSVHANNHQQWKELDDLFRCLETRVRSLSSWTDNHQTAIDASANNAVSAIPLFLDDLLEMKTEICNFSYGWEQLADKASQLATERTKRHVKVLQARLLQRIAQYSLIIIRLHHFNYNILQ